MINRDDMLELTRRMTSARTHLVRMAGAYIDEDGFIDGTFNTHFLNLKGEDKKHSLEIAKSIPYAETNSELKEYVVPDDFLKPEHVGQLLYALRDCELKNDALLLNLYEMLAEKIGPGKSYAIYVYEGVYDVPVKAADKERLDVSEEVYKYLLCGICPLTGEYEAGMPDCGFLWPAFKDRSTDMKHINILEKSNLVHLKGLKEFLEIRNNPHRYSSEPDIPDCGCIYG